MKTGTALNHRNRVLAIIKDEYRMAEIAGLSSEVLRERVDVALSTIKHCPEWVRQYLRGYEDCLRDGLYRDKLMYGGFVGGVFYSTHSDRQDYYQKHGISPREFNERQTESGHYWKTTKQPLPYFIG